MKLQLIIHEQQEVIMQMESILNYIKLLLWEVFFGCLWAFWAVEKLSVNIVLLCMQ